MGNIGLVFAGGGGKGSYEIGVWKYLNEIGFDSQICAISGTSVGALNAALFLGTSYETAEEIWIDISPKKIMTPKKITVKDIALALAVSNLSNNTNKFGTGRALDVIRNKTGCFDAGATARLLLPMIESDSLFSRDGLTEMIMKIDFPLFYNRDIPCYATCFKCPSALHPSLGIERFKLNDYDKDAIIRILLASSAIPGFFPQEQIGKKYYYDGGLPIVGDNIPVKPVYDLGAKYIIVVHLDKDDKPTPKEKYPNSKIIDIIPSVDLGNIIKGTIDFTSKGVKWRLDLGYSDAKQIITNSFKGEWIGGKIMD